MSLPIDESLGARPREDGSARFVVWAPNSGSVGLRIEGRESIVAMDGLSDGYFGATIKDCRVGTRYWFVLGGKEFADPVSRSQPDGVHGGSAVVDLARYQWSDGDYQPRPLWDHVISETHIGTFTSGGTFTSAIESLDELVEVGISAVEVMPVAQFPGERNWGYDGVFPLATQSSYGGPEAFQAFVDACHQRGLAVILDVVYNHLGPEGNVLGNFGPYFTDRYQTPWGPAINFDGPGSDDVRTYFLESARQWFVDFHVDALRLDATHEIVDHSAFTFFEELSLQSERLRDLLGRPCDLIAESAANDPRVVSPRAGLGFGMDAQWNDDFHHSLHTALTNEHSGYYVDYHGASDLARAMESGYVFQGQYSLFRQRRHGAPSGSLEPDRFVIFAQNHDQIGNRPRGERLVDIVSFEQARLACALVLLSPGVPMLFMGEEYGERAPFPYFVDHSDPELIAALRDGRAREFPDLSEGQLFDPMDEESFRVAVLDRSIRGAGEHAMLWSLHRDLIALRRAVPAIGHASRESTRAWADDGVITLLRTHLDTTVVVLFNLGASKATCELPSGYQWRALSDGSPHVASSSVRLSPWEFGLYQSEGTQ